MTHLDFSGVLFSGVTINVNLLLSEFSIVIKVNFSVDSVN
jgi:hypothetical protein